MSNALVKIEHEIETEKSECESLTVIPCCNNEAYAFADKVPLRCQRPVGHRGMHTDSHWYWT